MRMDWLHLHWLFEMADNDPERLLAMSEDEFRDALADAGFDADELEEQFHVSITALLSRSDISGEA